MLPFLFIEPVLKVLDPFPANHHLPVVGPDERKSAVDLTIARTLYPRRLSSLTILEARKPLDPVTKAFMFES
jgi:hypothetical protein